MSTAFLGSSSREEKPQESYGATAAGKACEKGKELCFSSRPFCLPSAFSLGQIFLDDALCLAQERPLVKGLGGVFEDEIGRVEITVTDSLDDDHSLLNSFEHETLLSGSVDVLRIVLPYWGILIKRRQTRQEKTTEKSITRMATGKAYRVFLTPTDEKYTPRT